MKCEYCEREITAGTEVISNGHYFCNSLHRYYWQQDQLQNWGSTNSSKKNSSLNDVSFSSLNDSPKLDPKFFDSSREMKLGDIFSVSFDLIKSTFMRNLIIILVFLIPAGLFMAYGMQIYFHALSHTVKLQDETGVNQIDPAQYYNMFAGMAVFFISIFIFLLAYLAVLIGITKIGCEEMEGEKISLNTAFRKIFSVTYFRGIGQALVVFAVILAFVIVIGIVIGIANLGDIGALKIMAGLLIFVSIFFIIYLLFKWYFAFIAMVHTDSGVFDSFSISSSLVKRNWWRVFGIVFLISIVVDFIISVISTPISFVFMWGYFSHYMKMLTGGAAKLNPVENMQVMSRFGFNLGLVIVFNVILQTLLAPLFNIVVYFDLRIRKFHYNQASKRISNQPIGPLSISDADR